MTASACCSGPGNCIAKSLRLRSICKGVPSAAGRAVDEAGRLTGNGAFFRPWRSSRLFITSPAIPMTGPFRSGRSSSGLRPAPHCRTGHRQLFAEGHARAAFRELAAGSMRQLDRAVCLPGKGHGILDHGRSARGHGGGQSVRFLHRAACREISLHLSGRIARGACALSCDRNRQRRVLRIISRASRTSTTTPSISSLRSTSRSRATSAI